MPLSHGPCSRPALSSSSCCFTVLIPHEPLFTPRSSKAVSLTHSLPLLLKLSKSLYAHKHSALKSQLHSISQSLDPQLPTLTDRDHRTQISTPEASTDAVVGFVVAVSDRSKGEMKMMVPMKTRDRRERREEKMAMFKGEEKKRKESF